MRSVPWNIISQGLSKFNGFVLLLYLRNFTLGLCFCGDPLIYFVQFQKSPFQTSVARTQLDPLVGLDHF